MFFTNAFLGGATGAGIYLPLAAGFSSAILGAFAHSRQSLRIKYVLVAVYFTIVTMVSGLLLLAGFEYTEFSEKWLNGLGFSALSGLIVIAAFFIAMPIMDTAFNFVTDFRYAELISTDRPLLKRLFVEAPGTFNHSIILANYAVACATAIGENTYVARAAAYYHDIGKLKNPGYFSENQSDGINPHDELTPEVSVSIIKKHVTNGIALAKEARLPEDIVKAIAEHHGTLPLRFFYDKAQKYSEADIADDRYRYESFKPSIKISAILMVCDACEATLRAVAPKSAEEAEKTVAGIINERIRYGQFTSCDITMRDFEIIKQTVVSVYAGLSHERISYPKAKDEELMNSEKEL